MRKTLATDLLRSFLVLVALLTAVLTLRADDRFALAVGEHSDIIIFGPHGGQVGDFAAPVIAQPVVITGGPSFQLSFGRDSNDKWSAILSPNPAHPADLHFSVLTKKVDADKNAVVTLTFSSSLNRVSIDPGYVGVVQVDSHTVRHHEVSRTSTAAGSSAAPLVSTAGQSPNPAQSAAVSAPAVPTLDAPVAQDDLLTIPASLDTAARDIPLLPVAGVTPGPLVSGAEGAGSEYVIGQPISTGKEDDQSISGALKKRRLFWAEPITGPHRNVPAVASNEMKLVAVHGNVSVVSPDGRTQVGTNGMVVPSGATVSTADASSAAVFMGGVNSARMLPNSGLVVAQNMEGSVRHTTIDLQKGGVFSRVGRRPGESQNYEVRTPEGVAAARGTEPLDLRVHLNFQGADHILHLVYVHKGTVDIIVDGKVVGTITGGTGKIGMASLGTPKLSQKDLEKYLDQALADLQPFNVTTIQALFEYENGGKLSSDELSMIQDALYGSLPTESAVGTSLVDFAPLPAGIQDLVPPTQIKPFHVGADEQTSNADQ